MEDNKFSSDERLELESIYSKAADYAEEVKEVRSIFDQPTVDKKLKNQVLALCREAMDKYYTIEWEFKRMIKTHSINKCHEMLNDMHSLLWELLEIKHHYKI